MQTRPSDGSTCAAVLPEFDELREELWEDMRERNLTRLDRGVGAVTAKKAAQFLIITREPSQFRFVKQASLEDGVSDSDVNRGELLLVNNNIGPHGPSQTQAQLPDDRHGWYGIRSHPQLSSRHSQRQVGHTHMEHDGRHCFFFFFS